jgi:hypothetical protein
MPFSSHYTRMASYTSFASIFLVSNVPIIWQPLPLLICIANWQLRGERKIFPGDVFTDHHDQDMGRPKGALRQRHLWERTYMYIGSIFGAGFHPLTPHFLG